MTEQQDHQDELNIWHEDAALAEFDRYEGERLAGIAMRPDVRTISITNAYDPHNDWGVIGLMDLQDRINQTAEDLAAVTARPDGWEHNWFAIRQDPAYNDRYSFPLRFMAGIDQVFSEADLLEWGVPLCELELPAEGTE